MNKKIRDNYDKYCSFINEEKILAKDQMILDEDKASRPDFKEKSMLAYSNNSKLPILGYPLLDGRQSAPV